MLQPDWDADAYKRRERFLNVSYANTPHFFESGLQECFEGLDLEGIARRDLEEHASNDKKRNTLQVSRGMSSGTFWKSPEKHDMEEQFLFRNCASPGVNHDGMQREEFLSLLRCGTNVSKLAGNPMFLDDPGLTDHQRELNEHHTKICKHLFGSGVKLPSLTEVFWNLSEVREFLFMHNDDKNSSLHPDVPRFGGVLKHKGQLVSYAFVFYDRHCLHTTISKAICVGKMVDAIKEKVESIPVGARIGAEPKLYFGEVVGSSGAIFLVDKNTCRIHDFALLSPESPDKLGNYTSALMLPLGILFPDAPHSEEQRKKCIEVVSALMYANSGTAASFALREMTRMPLDDRERLSASLGGGEGELICRYSRLISGGLSTGRKPRYQPPLSEDLIVRNLRDNTFAMNRLSFDFALHSGSNDPDEQYKSSITTARQLVRHCHRVGPLTANNGMHLLAGKVIPEISMDYALCNWNSIPLLLQPFVGDNECDDDSSHMKTKSVKGIPTRKHEKMESVKRRVTPQLPGTWTDNSCENGFCWEGRVKKNICDQHMVGHPILRREDGRTVYYFPILAGRTFNEIISGGLLTGDRISMEDFYMKPMDSWPPGTSDRPRQAANQISPLAPHETAALLASYGLEEASDTLDSFRGNVLWDNDIPKSDKRLSSKIPVLKTGNKCKDAFVTVSLSSDELGNMAQYLQLACCWDRDVDNFIDYQSRVHQIPGLLPKVLQKCGLRLPEPQRPKPQRPEPEPPQPELAPAEAPAIQLQPAQAKAVHPKHLQPDKANAAQPEKVAAKRKGVTFGCGEREGKRSAVAILPRLAPRPVPKLASVANQLLAPALTPQVVPAPLPAPPVGRSVSILMPGQVYQPVSAQAHLTQSITVKLGNLNPQSDLGMIERKTPVVMTVYPPSPGLQASALPGEAFGLKTSSLRQLVVATLAKAQGGRYAVVKKKNYNVLDLSKNAINHAFHDGNDGNGGRPNTIAGFSCTGSPGKRCGATWQFEILSMAVPNENGKYWYRGVSMQMFPCELFMADKCLVRDALATQLGGIKVGKFWWFLSKQDAKEHFGLACFIAFAKHKTYARMVLSLSTVAKTVATSKSTKAFVHAYFVPKEEQPFMYLIQDVASRSGSDDFALAFPNKQLQRELFSDSRVPIEKKVDKSGLMIFKPVLK